MLETILGLCFIFVVGMWICDSIYPPYKSKKNKK